MGKTIIKQVMLTLLVCVAVGLFFIIIFYNFIPSNKAIPSKVQQYQTPNSVSDEIASSIGSEDKNAVYEITSADITEYKNSKVYEAGKVDPFDSISDSSDVTSTNATSSTTVNTGSAVSAATTTSGTTTRTTTAATTTNTNTTTRTTTSTTTSSTAKNTTSSSTTDNYYKASGISKGGK